MFVSPMVDSRQELVTTVEVKVKVEVKTGASYEPELSVSISIAGARARSAARRNERLENQLDAARWGL
jgi:hypothetical protein